MKDRRSGRTAVLLIALVWSMAINPMAASAQNDEDLVVGADPNSHCVATLDPVQVGSGKTSTVSGEKCFDEFWEAIYEATDGRVLLPRDTVPGQVPLGEIERMNEEGKAVGAGTRYM